MPKTEIDYSNTIIYKITCNNPNVNDLYVGHTTNFVQRKHAHKQSCINDNCKLYNVIRNNGGWNNWNMEIINFFNCKDHYEARKKEQEYFVSLNATLNIIEPMPKPKFKPIMVTETTVKNTFFCEKCNIYCDNAKLFEIHNNTKKHTKQEEMEVDKSQKIPQIFSCENCDYYTSNKKDLEKHLLTPKHQKTEEGSILEVKKSQNYTCICGKICKTHGGIWKHKQKCQINEEQNAQELSIQELNNQDLNNQELNNQITPELIMSVLQQNKELQQMLIDQNKTIIELSKNNSNTNISNSNINSHNKAFNLNFFLNETCKDAMNIMDFVDSIKIQLSDLENFGTLGYVDGISKIIIQNLKLLDENKRPVHCADSKREIMYVKDENKWEKEDENKQKMRKVIKHVTHKNTKLFKEFKEKYPGCEKSESRFSNKYDKLIVEAFGGKGDNDVEKEDKIIRNISKNVTISKVNL